VSGGRRFPVRVIGPTLGAEFQTPQHDRPRRRHRRPLLLLSVVSGKAGRETAQHACEDARQSHPSRRARRPGLACTTTSGCTTHPRRTRWPFSEPPLRSGPGARRTLPDSHEQKEGCRRSRVRRRPKASLAYRLMATECRSSSAAVQGARSHSTRLGGSHAVGPLRCVAVCDQWVLREGELHPRIGSRLSATGLSSFSPPHGRPPARAPPRRAFRRPEARDRNAPRTRCHRATRR
jgi:hypothetical protein